jgi:hypothetical protein
MRVRILCVQPCIPRISDRTRTLGKGPGFRGVCARTGVSETLWSRKSWSQWRDSGHSLSRRFFNVRVFRPTRPETGSLRTQTGSLRRGSVDEPECLFTMSSVPGSKRDGGMRRRGAGRNRTRSLFRILAEAEQSLLIRPSVGQSLCQVGDCHT